MPTRRLVLTAALATGALGACTATESPVAPTPAEDPDAALANDALAAESALLALLDTVTAGRPRRVRALTSTRAVHEAHVQLLREAATATPSANETVRPFPGDDHAAYLAMARAEDRLGQTLRRAAFAAESGPFARVLAGMAAAAAQQSATLRTLA